MKSAKNKLIYWLEFLLALTEKEIKARYKHAVLGFLWVVLNPLLQMLVIGFVFQFFVPVEVDNYFLFLFTGLLPWNFFAMSISKTTPMFVFERSLIQKAKFPRESIVLSIVMSNLFHLMISLSLLALFIMLLGKFNIFQFFLLPVALIWLTILTSALSLLFSSLNVKFRDVNFVVQAIMPLWFYATPVVYTLDLIPTKLQPLFYLNPMTSIVELFRYALLDQNLTSYEPILIALLVTFIFLYLSILVFKRESPNFDDWV